MPNSGCIPDDKMDKPSAAQKLVSPAPQAIMNVGGNAEETPVATIYSRKRSSKGAPKGRLKVYIYILLLLSACLLAACAFLLYSYINNSLTPKDLCVSTECIRAAATIVESMDPTADPCDDFYQFACGNFVREHQIPDTDFSEDWFTNRNHHVLQRVREYLEQNDTVEETKPVHQARVMFRACKDIESLENVSLGPLMKFLDHLGLPSTPPFTLSEASISWVEAVAHIKRHIDKDIFIGFDVMADPSNNRINKLSVGIPGESSPVPSHHEHSRLRRPPLRSLLAKGGGKGKVAWKEYIVKTMKYILEYNNKSSKALNSSIHEAALQIMEFEKDLILLKENFSSTDPTKDDLPNYFWVSELQEIMDKADPSTPSQIDWQLYIEVLFKDIDEVNLDLENKDMLAVYNLDYLIALMKLMSKTPDSVKLLTVWWEIVMELAPHTTTYMRDLRSAFEEKTLGEVAIPSRPTHCAYVVYKLLDVAVGTLAAKESFLDQTKPQVITMMDDIQFTFLEAVEGTTWIDSKTKGAIKEKIAYTKRRIGFPTWILDPDEVEDYYDTLEMYEKTHLENILTYLGRSVYSSFKDLHSFNTYNDSGFNPLDVNAAYSVQENTIYVPLGMIQFPFYHLGLDALNYGAIGSILGHELVHSLDTDGRKYDKLGNYRMWWRNESIEAFTERVSCLVDKYSNYYVEDVDDWVDGNRTLGENIADTGGLRAALGGYHRRVARWGAEPKLPGLHQYTHDQLFYLAFANIWCENWSQTSMRWTLEGEHAPNYVRVMGTLSNSPEFGKAWNCPVDSEMNPEHKCHVW